MRYDFIIVMDDERHLINIILTFIEQEINNVVSRLSNAKKAEEKTMNIELDNQLHEGVEYKAKVKKVNKELEGLW